MLWRSEARRQDRRASSNCELRCYFFGGCRGGSFGFCGWGAPGSLVPGLGCPGVGDLGGGGQAGAGLPLPGWPGLDGLVTMVFLLARAR